MQGVDIDKLQMQKAKILCCCIPVKYGVSWYNLSMILLIESSIVVVGAYWNAQLILLMQNKDYFNIPAD